MKVRKKKLLRMYILAIPIFVLIFFLLYWNMNLWTKYSKLSEKREGQVEQIQKGIDRKEEIEKDFDALDTQEGVERIMIEKNNLKKEGERMIKILDY